LQRVSAAALRVRGLDCHHLEHAASASPPAMCPRDPNQETSVTITIASNPSHSKQAAGVENP
jgi:hypothetical protein